MPNWTYNSMTTSKKVYDAISDGNGGVNFNKFIPEPTTKEECILLYGEQYIIKDVEHSPLMSDAGREWFDWYTWHCDFWGTKWNACDAYAYDDGDGYYYIEFNTAWAPPQPLIEKLCATFPDEPISGYFEEEANLFPPTSWENDEGIVYYTEDKTDMDSFEEESEVLYEEDEE